MIMGEKVDNMNKISRTNLIYNISLLLIALSAIVGMASAGANLIANGDFESGYTGFYTDYSKLPLYIYETSYNITNDPHNASGFFTSFGDHTSGSGLMMVVNGARTSNRTVWSQTVAVVPNTDYNYSVWIASVYAADPARLQFQIDSDIVGNFTASSTPGVWQKFTTTWNSGSKTSVVIRIIDLNINGYGNDFALDDISLEAINHPPVAEAGGPYKVDEGSSVNVDSSGSSDPDIGDALTYTWDLDNDSIYETPGASVIVTPPDGPKTLTVGLQVLDDKGGISTDTAIIIVSNVDPTIDSLSAPYLAQIGTAITGTGTFHDPGVLDTFDAIWNWGDGTNTISLPAGSVSTTDSHTYVAPGVYSASLQITDKDGGSDIENISHYIVIYDPDGGFVTGGGWINSQAGAYATNPTLTGKANFGFVSKYQNGATIPTGETEFQLKAADLNFHSTGYDWLAVAGTRAQYKGSGTINGTGDYAFILTAIDGQVNGSGETDKFRIKIWDKVTGAIVYDNQNGATDDSNLLTAIAGGSIVIHE